MANDLYANIYNILSEAEDRQSSISEQVDEILDLVRAGGASLPVFMEADLSNVVGPLIEVAHGSKGKSKETITAMRAAIKKLGFDWRVVTDSAQALYRVLAKKRLDQIQVELGALYEKRSVLSTISDEFEDVKPSKKLIAAIKKLETEQLHLAKLFPEWEPKETDD